jgi:NAD(P)-dependent dehydrogenase (short-subunit alcohol dehydrogenase family)
MSRLSPSFTQDGYEKAFQINYLANFLLVHCLLPSLEREHCRIVLVTSFTHDPQCSLAKLLPLPRRLWTDVETLAHPACTQKKSTGAGFRRYAASKMCLMMLMHSVQERLDKSPHFQNIIILAVDPGRVGATEIMREQDILCRIFVENILCVLTPLLQKLFKNSLLRTPSRSSDDILRGGIGTTTGNDSALLKGKVLNGSRIQLGSEETRTKANQKVLWDASTLLVDLTEQENEAFRT